MYAPSFTTHLAFIEGLGGPELMMILFVVLLLFGGEKLPEFARGLGKTMREFRKAASNVEDEFKRAIDDVERNAAGEAHLDDTPAPRHAVPPPTYASQSKAPPSPHHDNPNPSDQTPPERRAAAAPSDTPN
ncbi:Sec-independent protein translocase subunit TatA/TatB [Cephaloticoccus capnophilus]|uniref:Sec-independent protein translocase subunit TatA/TatB n=1 Tax=Cephaloticoccus capnophilus TaxID=1548208 RepID=UPI000837BF39|nr:twin-arginine translocase TatA/TatE family subunit [Cephaloticoccus capnophilus]